MNPDNSGTSGAESRLLEMASSAQENEPVRKWEDRAEPGRATCFFILLIVLSHLGCDSRTSGRSNKHAESSSVSSQTALVPLTNMVLIKAGTFWRIKYPVTLTEDFWLSKYEVTQGEYAAV